ncbi:hypothetical protein GQ600_16903 [Phytophthora cactorum]|nr:hypothetical protein GQ600_16903 [Phytophthora cactorum]
MEDKGMVLLRAFSTISPTSPTGVFLSCKNFRR